MIKILKKLANKTRRKRYVYLIHSRYSDLENQKELLALYESKFVDDITNLFILSGCKYLTIEWYGIHLKGIKNAKKNSILHITENELFQSLFSLEMESRLNMEKANKLMKFCYAGYIELVLFNKSKLVRWIPLAEGISAFFSTTLNPEELNEIISNNNFYMTAELQQK